MTYYISKNTSSPSTTWVPTPDRMRGSRREGTDGAARRPSFASLRRRDPKEYLTIRIKYRGGAQAWWLVEARGVRQAFPGHLAIHDVMSIVNQTSKYDRQ